MDFRQLEIFIKIVELKSFSKAAYASFLTQPTVSAHIRSLEEEVGLKLLDRLSRETLPTAAGQLLYKYAKRLVALRDEARQGIDQLKGRAVGHLLVGGSNIPGEYLLPGLIGKFRGVYPGITVTLIIGDTSLIAEKVLNGECEIGVIGSRLENSRLEFKEFVNDELILIAGPDYPLSAKRAIKVEEIATAPFVGRERGSGSRMAMERWLAEMGLDPARLNVVAEMGSMEAVKQAIKGGMGISIVSSIAVEEDLRHKSLKTVPFKGKKMRRNFHIVSSRRRTRSPACQAFVTFLEKASKSLGHF